MSDYTGDDERNESGGSGGAEGGIEEEPPIYRSGRVRIIGAEPAGEAVHEATGPVVESHPDMPHWNDAPTGQVPAILDRGGAGDDVLAPPTWREEETDWVAHEELFEPAMLSGEHEAVGAMANDSEERVDMERQPWHFDSELSDETLIIEPDYPDPETAIHSAAPVHVPVDEPIAIDEEPEVAEPPASRLVGGRRRVAKTPLAERSAAAASRLSPPAPPAPPEPRARPPRTPRTSRINPAARNRANGGTGGRDMQVALGVGVAFGVVALICFKAGAVASAVLVTLVVVLAAAEAFAAFRRAQYHPATLIGLVGVLSLMFETYNKGVSALPLVLVLLVAGCFVWYLARVEASADPVAGMASTIFVFGWVGGFGSFSTLLLNPNLFPHRHGVAFMLAAVIITVAADVTALLVGSAMGRHPLAPSISPNKSWEGVIGGAFAAVLAAVIIVHFIHPWTVGKAAVLGLVVAVVSPIGDLAQSMIKRNLGLKDMGSILPGHGGLLDRFDGLLFVLPATYFVVKAFHLG